MELKELYRLVKKGEGDQLEFKRKAAHPEKIIKEAVAFANTKGGNLLIGVDDNGTIPGLKYVEEEVYVLNKALDRLCKPRLNYTYEIIPLDENETRSVVLYTIPESNKKPHYAMPEEGAEWGKTYVRAADKSIQASKEVRRIIKLSQRKNSRAFSIDEQEKRLLQYLDENQTITLTQFQELSNLNRYKASNILITLVLNNIIRIHPNDKADLYSLSSAI